MNGARLSPESAADAAVASDPLCQNASRLPSVRRMSSSDSDRLPQRGPRFLLPARAWLIIAAAFAAGLLLSALLWFGKRGEPTAAAPTAVTTPADAADAAAGGLPAPQPTGSADPGGASGMEEADPDAPPPRLVERAPAQEAPVDAPAFADGEETATAADTTRAPVAVETPAPRYPSAALRRGDSGEVLLQVRVGADGNAQDVEVVRSSNSRALDRAAVAAVRRWRFQPALREGQPVPGMVQVPIVFSPAR